jgi:hypothetical protein
VRALRHRSRRAGLRGASAAAIPAAAPRGLSVASVVPEADSSRGPLRRRSVPRAADRGHVCFDALFAGSDSAAAPSGNPPPGRARLTDDGAARRPRVRPSRARGGVRGRRVSFLSPCVLPLVPGYVSIVSGVGLGELGTQPRRVTLSTAAFVAGFGTIFVLLGAGAAWFGDVLLSNRRTLEIVAGVFIVIAGLVYAGAPLPLTLLREKHLALPPRALGVPTAALAGLPFGVGWTPCIGPTLAAVLALAAAREAPTKAPSCSPSIRSGSACPSSSSASASPGRSDSSACSDDTAHWSASAPARCSSSLGCSLRAATGPAHPLPRAVHGTRDLAIFNGVVGRRAESATGRIASKER